MRAGAVGGPSGASGGYPQSSPAGEVIIRALPGAGTVTADDSDASPGLARRAAQVNLHVNEVRWVYWQVLCWLVVLVVVLDVAL